MSWLKKNKLLVLVLIIAFAGYSSYKYAYKPHETIEESTSIFKGEASSFMQKANENFNNWNSKVVTIAGKVTSIDKEGITLNEQIFCQFKNSKDILLIKENTLIQIKGRVIGYDNLLDELKLNQCILK